MDEKLLKRIVRQGGVVTVTVLPKPRTFEFAVQIADISNPVKSYDRRPQSCLFNYMFVSKKTLILRNLQWIVTLQEYSESLLILPVLEGIGLRNRDILTSSTCRLGGEGYLESSEPSNRDQIYPLATLPASLSFATASHLGSKQARIKQFA